MKEAKPEDFESEVSTLLKFIGPLPAHAKILDCPCGKGFQAKLLEQKGFDVTGIDGNDVAIRIAQTQNNGPVFREGKFDQLGDESLVPHESMDAVLCIDRSFGYGATVKENEETLMNYYKKLKPGGRMGFVWIYNLQMPYQDAPYASERLAAGDTEDMHNGMLRFHSNADGRYVEDRLPDDYSLPPEHERFRHLQVWHAEPLVDGRPPKDSLLKWADYLAVAHDGKTPADAGYKNRQPVDAPVMRALAKHAGLPEPQFKSKYFPKENLYLCGLVITKPETDPTDVAAARSKLRQKYGDSMSS